MKFLSSKNGTMKQYLIISLMAVSACSSKDKKVEQITSRGTAVHVVLSAPTIAGGQELHISGQVQAGQTAGIATRVMGYITAINVKVGDHVHAGELLVSISNKDIQAKKAGAEAMIAEAEAATANAKKDFDRFTSLYKQQSATDKELENATQQYTSAKARLEAARQMKNEVDETLRYTSLTAPFDGTVTSKTADAGSMATPGTPILTIEQAGSYEVDAAVPEQDINKITQGKQAAITIGALNKTIQGTITAISSSSGQTGGLYMIKIAIPVTVQDGVYAGMYATVTIQTAGRDTTTAGEVLVPSSCVITKGQLTGLYTLSSNNTAMLRWVRLGRTYGDKVEVLSGLERNENFILSADQQLSDGTAVKEN